MPHVGITTLRQLEADWAQHSDAGVSRVYAGVYAACVRRANSDPTYMRLLESCEAYPDGMGVVWALRRAGLPVPERMATTDIVHDIAKSASLRGLRMGLYGGKEQIVLDAAAALQREHPALQVHFVRNGFSAVDPSDLLGRGLNVVLVGLGTGLQEEWALRAARACDKAGEPLAFFTCGGLFDHLAGETRRAPTIVQRAGFEWLWRLVQEPGRLGFRYLQSNPWFAFHFLIRRRPHWA